MIKNFYNGDVIDNVGKNQNDGIVKLTVENSVMLKTGDAIILILNDSEVYSLNANNFSEKIFLKNTSIIPSIKVSQATTNSSTWEKNQTTIGGKIFFDYLLKFKDGKLADAMFGGLLES